MDFSSLLHGLYPEDSPHGNETPAVETSRSAFIGAAKLAGHLRTAFKPRNYPSQCRFLLPFAAT
jgi:hypothetical protein